MQRSRSTELSVARRLALAATGGVLSALLGLSCFLVPSPSGMGTHQQLGLPPCTVVQLLGARCPACGMTTSWAHLVRGRPVAAMRANTGGALLGVLAAAGSIWTLGSAWRGRWWGGPISDRALATSALAVATVILIDWLARLWLDAP